MPFDTATTNPPVKSQRRTVVFPVTISLCMALAALTAAAFNSETIVATGFERAFANLQKPSAQVSARAYDGVSGSEEFWLRSQADAMLIKAVAVGNHLTVSANGTERHLIITSVADADDAVTHIQTAGNRALLVTCREGDGRTGREVYFRLDAGQIVELPQTKAPTPAPTQRAL